MRSGDGAAGSSPSATCRRRRASAWPPSHHSWLARATVSGRRSSGPAVRSASSTTAARRCRVAGGGLRVGEAQPGGAAWRRRSSEQPQRGGVEARGAGRGGGLQLVGGRGSSAIAASSPGERRARRDGRARPGRPRALERVRGAGVRAEPPAAGRRRVDGVADDGVAEGEAARRAARPHERAREQLVERVERRGLGQLGHRCRQARLERVAGDRRRVEQAPRRGSEAGELRGERSRDSRGHGVVVGDADAGRAAAARELLEVERVAAAVGVERLAPSPTSSAASARVSGPSASRVHAALGQRGAERGRDRRRAAGPRGRPARAGPAPPAGGARARRARRSDAGSAQWTSSRHSTSGRDAASRSSRSRSARCVRWRSVGARRAAERGQRGDERARVGDRADAASARWSLSASVNSPYGRSASNSDARAASTAAPVASARVARCASSRDLPMPGSPSIEITAPPGRERRRTRGDRRALAGATDQRGRRVHGADYPGLG